MNVFSFLSRVKSIDNLMMSFFRRQDRSGLEKILAQVPHFDLSSPEVGEMSGATGMDIEIEGQFVDVFGSAQDQAVERQSHIAHCTQTSAFAFDTGDVGPELSGPVNYTSGGRRHAYTLRHNGTVWARPDPHGRAKSAWSPVDRADGLANRYDRIGAPDQDRQPYRFMDMVAAGPGRLFCKSAGADDYYIMAAAHPRQSAFVEPDGATRVFRYTAYNKVDPTLGRFDPTSNPLRRRAWAWTDAHLSNASGARFDVVAPESAFHHLFWLFDLVAAAPIAAMAVRLEPNVWQHLDMRPEPGVAPPPAGSAFPTYTMVRFDRRFWRGGQQVNLRFDPSSAAEPRCRGDAYAYHRVLSLGVGRLHPHDQVDRRGEGEIGNLDYDLQDQDLEAAFEPDDRSYLFEKYGRGRTFWENFVRAFHGPIDDADGYNDGTVNYYQLVQHVSDSDMEERGDNPTNCFGILHADEQAAAAGRWRLLHLEDYRNRRGLDPDPDAGASSFVDAGSNYLLSKLVWDERDHEEGRKRDRSFHFSSGKYFCPFTQGRLDRSSRMGVSQQLVAISGRDPKSAEIMTINFSHSTMDRTWRRRPSRVRFDGRGRHIVPMALDLFASDHAPDPQTGALPNSDLSCAAAPSTVAVRGDLTLTMRGQCRTKDREMIAGRFHQANKPAIRPLPAPISETECPTFEHEWQFVSEHVHWLFDRYPIYGALEHEDARFQAYAVHASQEDKARLTRWLSQSDSSHAPVSFDERSAAPTITQPVVEIERLQEMMRLCAEEPSVVVDQIFEAVGRAAGAELEELKDGLWDTIFGWFGFRSERSTDILPTAQGLSGNLLLELERRLVVTRALAWPSRFNRDPKTFRGRLMHRAPFGLLMAWDDHRDDEVAELDRPDEIPTNLQASEERGFRARIGAPTLQPADIWLGRRVKPNPPRADFVTIDASRADRETWRLRIHMGLARLTQAGAEALPVTANQVRSTEAYLQEAWRLKIGLFPDAPAWADVRDISELAVGDAPEPLVVVDQELADTLKAHSGESSSEQFVGFIDVTVPHPRGLDEEVNPFSENGRLKYGVGVWFENILGRLGTPDRLSFRQR
ncbi:MAG: hypothetical protein AAF367_05640 [Pseudomonadota bacterium]